MSLTLEGKVALVTGGSSGIGRATALQLANAGAYVAIVARNEERAGSVVAEIQGAGGDAMFVKADVGEQADLDSMVQNIIDRWGRLDIAVNNAAAPPSEIGPLQPITEISVEHWDRLMAVNLRGAWLGMKYEIPAMIRSGGGCIVNVSSIAGGRGVRGMGHYVASKFGLNGLTRVAAVEFAQAGVRINAVMPGPVDSPILNEMETMSPGYRQAITAMVPMGRMGLDKEVASAVSWLCSDGAGYVTGAVIPVDGGILA